MSIFEEYEAFNRDLWMHFHTPYVNHTDFFNKSKNKKIPADLQIFLMWMDLASTERSKCVQVFWLITVKQTDTVAFIFSILLRFHPATA